MKKIKRIQPDPGLGIRMFITMALLGLVYFLFLGFLSTTGISTGGIMLIAGGMLFAQWFFSAKLAMLSMRAKIVSEAEEPGLHAMVASLADQAGIRKPRVAISELPIANAFATGRGRSDSVVAVTRQLMQGLTPEELEGVLAHEVAHIVHRDVAVMTIANFFATVAFFIMRSWMFMGMGRDRDNNSGPGLLAVYMVSMVVWFISQLLILALSRYREYAADRGACSLTNNPRALASALVKISGQHVPERVAETAGRMNSFFIMGVSAKELFSTHPSLDRRLEALARIAAELDGGVTDA